MKFSTIRILKDAQFRGFSSAICPRSLPGSLESLVSNGRLGQGLPIARSGDEAIGIPYEGALLGCFEASFDGVSQLFRAVKVEGVTSVVRSVDGGTTWFDIMPTTGAFGNTRFSTGTNPSIRFCVVRDHSLLGYAEKDLLVIQNGDEAPRIYGGSSGLSSVYSPSGTLGVAPTVQPSPPTNVITNPFFHFCATIADGSPSFDNSTGIASHLEGLSNPNHYISVTIGADYEDGNTTTWSIAPVSIDGGVGAPPTQLVLLAYSPDSVGSKYFWQQMKVEIDDGTDSWVTIFDPSASSDAIFMPIVQDGDHADENWYQIAFSLDRVSFDVIRSVRLSWGGTANSLVGYVAAMAAGGQLRGSTRLAVAFYASDSRSLGSATISTRVSDLSVYQCGGGSQFSDIKIVEDPRFYFDFSVAFDNSPAAQKDSGVDYALLFRSDPGESNYYLVGKTRVAHWNGSTWVYDFLHPQATGMFGDQDFSFPLPDAGMQVIPGGLSMSVANGRLYVGAGSRLWFSESDRPLSFRKSVRFFDATNADPSSGGSVSFEGQAIQALVPQGSFAGAAEDLSTPISGATTLHVLTDRNLFQLSGFDAKSLSRPIPIAPYGTLSPMSVGRSKTGFYWLDDRGQVSFFSPQGLSRISVDLVDDMTTTIPANRKAWAWGACANDRYYLAFTPPGSSTNDKILVWNERFGSWESVDTGATPAQALVPFYSDGYVKLLRFSDTKLYEHEQPGNTSNVDFKIVFREYTAGDLSNGPKRLETGAMTVWVDGAPDGYTLTCKRVDPSTGAEAEGTIEVGSAPRAIYVDTPSTGLAGDSIQPSIEGSVPGGTKFHGVWLNMSSAPSGAIGS